MQACPTCSKRLYRAFTRDGPVYVCRSCGGRAVSVSVLRKTASADFLRRLRHKSAHSVGERERACPLCARAMAKVDFREKDREVVLEVCGPCRLIWFDPGEYVTAVPDSLGRPKLEIEPPGPGDDGASFGLTGTEHAWQVLPAIVGLPIEYGPNRLRDRPLATWTLATVMGALFVLLLRAGGGLALGKAIFKWGFIPNEWTRYGGLTLLTSFFLHAGWFHLIGNGYFLVVFGDNVEDHLGRLRFLLLLLGSHVFGSLVQGVLGPDPDVPCVGASAGVSGVIAYYAIVFPRAKIGIFLWVFTLFRVLRMPALMGLVLFILYQLVGVFWLGQMSRVGYLAHLGGVVVGAFVGIVMRGRGEMYAL